jgi:hypothetical protein
MNQVKKEIKSKLLFSVSLFVSSIVSAQSVSIEIKSDRLYLNSKKITKETTLQDIRSIVGTPNRKFDKLSTIWTYDSLGLKIYIGPQDSSLEAISLDFKKGDLEFSPRKEFNDKLIINSQPISVRTSIADFEKMNIGFESSITDWYRTVLGWHNASTKYLTLLLDYSRDNKILEVVEITFK